MEATKSAMADVGGPVIAIALVLAAVFVPVAFLGGLTGQLYKQFALTLAVSVILSAVCALTFTPAMCALLLKPVEAAHPRHGPLGWFFAKFNGPDPRVNTWDADDFHGWAAWSGTSFATPVVVVALAREMVLGSCGAAEAVKRVVYAAGALRIRCLGTVVTA